MKLPARRPVNHPSPLSKPASRRVKRQVLTRRETLASLVGLAGLAGQVPAWASAEAPPSRRIKEEKPGPLWRPDHTVIVVLENLSAYEATASQLKERKAPVYSPTSDWRFLNELAGKGARFSNAHFAQTPYGSGLPTRPSQPNYLYLFSGHHQGVLPAWFEDSRSPYEGVATRDHEGRLLGEPRRTHVGVGNSNVPSGWLPFTSPNLGAAILQTGGTFLSFCESLPYPSWNCGTDSGLVPCSATAAVSDDYRRKHNPAVNWTDQIDPTSDRGRRGDLAHHVMPVSVNLGFEPTKDPVLQRWFRGFDRDAHGQPLSFEALPDVSIVVPNEQHDAHSNTARASDDWLRAHIGPYADWALSHNSLLIITFDEDGSTDTSKGDAYMTGAHRIPTLFVGAGVQPGVYAQRIDHLNVLATVLWLHGALDRFKTDFSHHHKVVASSGSEAELAWRNLEPITSVFRRPVVHLPASAASHAS